MRQAHSASFVVLALLLAGCDVTSSPDRLAAAIASAQTEAAAEPAAAPTPAPPAGDPLAGLACPAAAAGSARSCTVAGFRVVGTLDACDLDSTSFGAIEADSSAVATDRLIDGRPAAHLAPGQFVCIHLHADPVGGGEGWMYVTAISPETIPACRTALCGLASARSSRTRPRADLCRIEAGRYTRGCPAGWVRSAQVDAYSMGL